MIPAHRVLAARARATVKQWVNQRGPCYPWSERDQVCRRVVAYARRHAFEEIPGPDELRGRWQRAYARWCRLRTAARQTLDSGRREDRSAARKPLTVRT